MVLDQKPTLRLVDDNKPVNLLVKDTKPSVKRVSLETEIYVLRKLGAGMWMGSPFLTYPNELVIPRP
jgi:hypothetical protein